MGSFSFKYVTDETKQLYSEACRNLDRVSRNLSPNTHALIGVWQTMMVDYYKNKMEIEKAHGEYMQMLSKADDVSRQLNNS